MISFRVLNQFILGSFLLGLVGMTLLNVVFDPLHVLRAPKEHDVYDRQSRFGHVGIVRHIETPDLVVGSSVFQDLNEEIYKENIGREMTRLPVPGASPVELYEVLDTALALTHKNIKHVTIGMDFFVWGKSASDAKWDHFPQSLYSDRFFVKPVYIGSFQTFSRLLRLFPDLFFLKDKKRTAHTRYRATYSHAMGQEEVFQHACSIVEQKKAQIEALSFQNAQENIDLYIKKLFKDYPTIEFTLLLPTYSLLEYAQYHDFGKFEDFKNFRETLGNLAFSKKNINIIDAQTDIPLMRNLAFFYDATHGGENILDPMLTTPVLSHADEIALSSDILAFILDRDARVLYEEMKARCSYSLFLKGL